VCFDVLDPVGASRKAAANIIILAITQGPAIIAVLELDLCTHKAYCGLGRIFEAPLIEWKLIEEALVETSKFLI
jgi:hypothetical protein